MLIIVCGALWRLGGWNKARWSGYRDILIPIILGTFFMFTTNWLIGLLTVGATNSIRMGYGAYDPEHDSRSSWLAKITKDREGSIIRAIYGLITSFAIGLFPTYAAVAFGHHLFALLGFFVYIVLNIAMEFLLNRHKVNVWITEPALGISRAAVLLLCR